MEERNKKVTTEKNIYKNKLLRIIYFENSVIGRTLGALGLRYLHPAEKVDILTQMRKER